VQRTPSAAALQDGEDIDYNGVSGPDLNDTGSVGKATIASSCTAPTTTTSRSIRCRVIE